MRDEVKTDAGEGTRLLPSSACDERDYEATPGRWFVLFYFSMASMNQCLGWFTFSSVSGSDVAEYFGHGMTKGVVDLLLNWGPIMGVVAFPIQTWLMARPGGLAMAIKVGIHAITLGCFLRTLPIFIDDCGLGAVRQSPGAFACYHIGQIIIAFAGPFVMGTVSRLACVWFKESERTIATGLSASANNLGTTVGYLNPLWLSTTPAHIPNMFYFSLALALFPSVCVLAYSPAAPKVPPSAAAAEDPTHLITHSPSARGKATDMWMASMRVAAANKHFVLLVTAAAVLSGVFSAWGGLFHSFLEPAGISETSVGWIGFGNGLAVTVGALASGFIMSFCRKRLKAGILVGLLGCLLSILWFTLQLPSVMWDTAHVIPRSQGTLVASLTVCGLFQGATTPLFYELSAELIYPAREGMSAGILVCLFNASSGLVILMNTFVTSDTMNVIMLVALAAVLLATAVVREEYKRPSGV